jgi:hypothetical protein
VGAQLPSDTEARVTAAVLAASGDSYDYMIAGMEELARVLYADGTREFDPNSAIAQILDPDAFAQSSGTPAAVWIALIVVLGVGVVLAVALRRRKKKAN